MTILHKSFMFQVKEELDEEVVKPINKMVGRSGIVGHSELYIQTPLWTGRLRASWRNKLGARFPSTFKGYKYKKDQGRGKDLYRAESITSRRNARTTMRGYNLMKHDGYTITNNIRYVEYVAGAHAAARHAETKIDSTLSRLGQRI